MLPPSEELVFLLSTTKRARELREEEEGGEGGGGGGWGEEVAFRKNYLDPTFCTALIEKDFFWSNFIAKSAIFSLPRSSEHLRA